MGAMESVIDRVKIRLWDEEIRPDDAILKEYTRVAVDRIMLRLGADEFPEVMESIAVDIVVKMIRRQYYEGVTAESTGSLSVNFVDDLLSEYAAEFEQYIKTSRKKVVYFI